MPSGYPGSSGTVPKCGTRWAFQQGCRCGDCKAAQAKFKRARIDKTQAFVSAYKLAEGCQDCGFDSHPAALDLHHIGTKTADVARMAANGNSITTITAELERCIVLCANCHRVRHHSKPISEVLHA